MLVLFRLARGMVGSETARFARCVKEPKAVFAYLAHLRDRQVGAGRKLVKPMLTGAMEAPAGTPAPHGRQ